MIAEKKDPSKHDFKPEWIVFWMDRMKELHEEDVANKKKEIRLKCNLPEDAVERTDELIEQYSVKVKKPERNQESSSNRDRKRREERTQRSRSRETLMKSGSRELSPNYRRNVKEEPRERVRGRSPVLRRSRSPERVRDRDRDNDRHRARDDRNKYEKYERERVRPQSREEFYRDESMMYPRERPVREEYYGEGYREKWTSRADYYGAPYGSRPPPSKYYPPMERMPYPREREPKSEERDTLDDEPLTVVSVLRLLTALEDLLGPSLGPKVIDLLAKALALEKVKPNSADELLLNEDNCVLFETVKEKLKGQLIAGVLEKNQIKAVKRAVKNIASVIHLVSESNKDKPKCDISATEPVVNRTAEESKGSASRSPLSTNTTNTSAPATSNASAPQVDREAIARRITAALLAQGKTDLSANDLQCLVDLYVKKTQAQSQPETQAPAPAEVQNKPSTSEHSKKPEYGMETSEKPIDVDEFDLSESTSSALESLTDTDLQTLLQNFSDLSKEEQQHLVIYLNRLDAIDPTRIEGLRKLVNLDEHVPRKPTASNSAPVPTKLTIGLNPRHPPTKIITEKIFDSDDDDDYTMDDVLKAASKNVKENETREEETRQSTTSNSYDGDQRRSNVESDDDDDCEIIPNDRPIGDRVKPMTGLFSDTQSLVANLMGSLTKNAKSHLDNLSRTDNPFSFLRGSSSRDIETTNQLPLLGNASDRSNESNQFPGTQSSGRPQTSLPFYQQQDHQYDSMESNLPPAFRSQYPTQSNHADGQWKGQQQQQQQQHQQHHQHQQHQQQSSISAPFQNTEPPRNFSFPFFGNSELSQSSSNIAQFGHFNSNINGQHGQSTHLTQNQPFQMTQINLASMRQQHQQLSSNAPAFQTGRQSNQDQIRAQVQKIQQQINANPYQRRF